MVRKSGLDKIFNELLQIRYRLDDIEANFSEWKPQPVEIQESELLDLPDHLRKTYLTVTSRRRACSATEVSNLTGRCRAMESNYLNQLTRMGWLTKHRDSKTARFRLVSNRMLTERPEEARSYKEHHEMR